MATYIIAMDPSVHADATAAQGAITDQGGTITKTYGFNLTYKVDCEPAELSEMTGVLFSEDYSTSATVTGAFNTDHLKRLCNDNAETSVSYNPTSTGSGEHVYLVDTGINTTHDEFTGATVNNLYSAFVDGDSNPVYTDTDGHGTSMASLIVGQNIGTAKDATVHNVRAMDTENYSGTIGAMVDALDACLVHHLANTPSQTKVVCICWTTAKNNLLDAKFTELEDNNMIVVCSAGNNALDVNNYSPAGLDQVMTVGGHDASLIVGMFSATTGSNLGEEVDVFGMAENVSIINFSNDTAYTTGGGTSVAAAQIAGLVVQYTDIYPSADARTIKSYVVAEGQVLNRGRSLTFNSALITATGATESTLKKSIGVSQQVGDKNLASVPSGLILTVQNGQTGTANVEINASASNVSVMAFSPMPAFATWNNSGLVTVDTDAANMTGATVPGIYHFAVKGTVSGTVLVEEFSIGVYTTDVSEIDGANEYYFDADTSSYDQVVNFNATKGE